MNAEKYLNENTPEYNCRVIIMSWVFNSFQTVAQKGIFKGISKEQCLEGMSSQFNRFSPNDLKVSIFSVIGLSFL